MARRFNPTANAAPCLLLLATAAAAQPFPEVTDAERALTEVGGHPGAPAVVLFKRAELRLRDSWTGTPTTLDVHVRTKILSESGKAFGQVAVGHSADVELVRFAGRTVLGDGRVVPLPADAVFREEPSRVRQRFVTKAAFPAVEVGAVLDYRYRLRWRSVFVQPWTFEEPVPTLLSEVVYHQPIGVVVEHHLRGDAPFRTQSDDTFGGAVTRVWLENLPPIDEEPYGFPHADLASQLLIVPLAETAADGTLVPRLDSWRTVCRNFEEQRYGPLRRKARQTKKKAAQLTAAGKSADAKLRTVYAFVRDEIRTTEGGLGTAADALDAVLAAGRGTSAEKALLLATMLEAVKVPARLVWAIDWREGFADLAVVNPGWFEKVLVLAEPAGERAFLDPGEKLAAGRLAPTNEGTQALVFDPESPQVVTLPATPAAESRRRAVLELAVDADGRVAGRGRLTLTGHHAWFYLGRLETAAAVRDTWRQWLELQHEGFAIAGVEVDEDFDEQRVELAWTMTQHDEHVLGDEVSLAPSRPLGPIRQRYTIPPDRRRTAVQVSFADRDEVELTLAWPPAFEVDLLPAAVDHASAAGTARATVDVDEAGRRLRYRRLFEITGTRYAPGEPYARLRELYTVMERHDAQSLVLLRSE